jgi:site-specific recombinase XerD
VVRARTHTKQRSLQPDRSRAERHLITPAAATPSRSAMPPAALAGADVVTLMDAVRDTWPARNASRDGARRRGLTALLTHLGQHPGADWQQRWTAAGLDEFGRPVRDLVDARGMAGDITHALALLCCLRIVRPSLPAFRSNQFVRYPDLFQAAARDPGLDRFAAQLDAKDTSPHFKRLARFDIAAVLTSQQITLAELTAEAFLHYAKQTRAGGFGTYGYNNYVGHTAWELLHEGGWFPPSVPATLRATLRAPAMTPEELVELYQLANHDVAGMLAAYLRRRSYDVDYSTLRGLALVLCSNFWREVERINPQQADLALSEGTYQAWRAGLSLRADGKPRRNQETILTAVRALYLDLQGWAAAEPEQWARWAAPCPITNREMRAGIRERRRTKERMDDRTRRLQPLLPVLVRAVDEQRQHLRSLLDAAASAAADEVISVDGRRYRRLFTVADARHRDQHGQANVRVSDEQLGTVVNVTFAEDTAFWSWALIETLRHTGARNEEVLELSQLSIRQCVRPNGEVIALLVIAPSKADRERVIPMSAELFHVVATIIRRLNGTGRTVPLATRYDRYEHITSAPQPFLFQRRIGQRNEVITPGALREMLARLCSRLADTHPTLRDSQFAPHDFRRLFATDVVNHGLPIHIGAALLGHLNIQTTHGYVTVFNEDVVRHYQTHLAARRAMRPEREYTPITDTEWAEFEAHFDKRKVELGQCGRPYATPCSHEHACLRCPMLRIDPRMLPRLDELEADLHSRRDHAQTKGWLGELEGLDLTLRFLAEKRAEATRLGRTPLLTIASTREG